MAAMAAALRDRFRRSAAGAKSGSATDSASEEADSLTSASLADGADQDSDDGDNSDDAAGEWLAYELHEWSLESRVMLEQLLVVDKVVHSWQGTTLMVHESLEAVVDNLVDEVQETEQSKEAANQPIGPDDELTAFDLSEWPDELRSELSDLLVQSRVPHIFDIKSDTEAADGNPELAEDHMADLEDARSTAADELAEPAPDLGGVDKLEAPEAVVVIEPALDELAVDPVEPALDESSFDPAEAVAVDLREVSDEAVKADTGVSEHEPDEDGRDNNNTTNNSAAADTNAATICDLLVRESDEERVELLIDDLLAREEEAQFEELDGLEVNDLLSTLFVACDRLRREPADVEGLQSARVAAQRMAGVRTPFGFAAGNWKNLRNSVAELLVLVESVSGLSNTASQEAPEEDAEDTDSQTSDSAQHEPDTSNLEDDIKASLEDDSTAGFEASLEDLADLDDTADVEDFTSDSDALRESAKRMTETLRTLV